MRIERWSLGCVFRPQARHFCLMYEDEQPVSPFFPYETETLSAQT